MRRWTYGVTWCLAVVVLAATQAAAAPDGSLSLLYDARVATAGAPVRSGPAESYYLTDTLAEGQTVEVYQERPDGWCAIRPPETSFSWVFSRHVLPVGNGLGRIDKGGVASRIGSSLSNQRDVSQVELREGEVVRVFDEETHDGQTWFKIAPPAGEFRWVHASHIRREGAADIEPTEEESAWRPTARPPQAPPLVASTGAENGGIEPVSTKSAIVSEAEAKVPATASPDVKPVAANAPGEFERQVADLELRLSRMVAEPTTTWDVAPLEQDAEKLLSQAQSTSQRDAVQGTLAKIDRFATIQRRTAQTGGNANLLAQNSATTPIGAPSGTQAAGDPNAQAGEAGRFDAVGVLRPVVSRRPGAPQFALVDARGQVVTFVTPSPDVNLQPYLGRRVGIVGSRGFMPEFRRNHVVAGRVSPLEGNLVR